VLSADGRIFGYRTVPAAADAQAGTTSARFEIEPAEAEIVRRIFWQYARGRSIKAIAFELNTEGVPFPAKDTKRGPARRGWAISTIHRILHNSKYVGRWVWNQTRFLKGSGHGAAQGGAPPAGGVGCPGLPRAPDRRGGTRAGRPGAAGTPGGPVRRWRAGTSRGSRARGLLAAPARRPPPLRRLRGSNARDRLHPTKGGANLHVSVVRLRVRQGEGTAGRSPNARASPLHPLPRSDSSVDASLQTS
jgi:hypothetical protein